MNTTEKKIIGLAAAILFFAAATTLYFFQSRDAEIYAAEETFRTAIQENHQYQIEVEEKEQQIETLKGQIADIKEKILQNVNLIDSLKAKYNFEYERVIEEQTETGYLPDQWNSQGEMHPRVLVSHGETDKDKTRDFVEKHCSAEVQKAWEHGYDYAEANGVKGSFIFAIAWADTECGKTLSTQNNPGNVNNNDRGNRVGFFTMEDGLEAITDTLNNKYLSGIEILGHLSPGGRKEVGSKNECSNAPAPYKCYCSSQENWNTNMKRALTSISGEEITGNFSFRK